jgi:hypothetical protein
MGSNVSEDLAANFVSLICIFCMLQDSSRKIKIYSAKLTLKDEMMNCYTLWDLETEVSVFNFCSVVSSKEIV